MDLFICSVKDLAAQAFMRPFFTPKTAMAVRSFSDEVNRNQADNMLYDHPEDYELYLVGMFDEEDGSIKGMEEPELLVRGKDVRR